MLTLPHQGAYYGAVNLVNTAIAAGVKKIVVTGTCVSLWDGACLILYRLSS